MKNLLIVAATVGAFLLPTAVHAAAPAHPYHLTTVKWILSKKDDLKTDDHYVTLVGHITDRDDDGDYFFTDGTGTIRLDAGNWKLPRGEKIVVGGRIDQAYLGFGHIEVNVERYHLANSSAKTDSTKPAPAKPAAATSAPVTASTPPMTATPPPAPAPAPAAESAPAATTPTLAPPAESAPAPAPAPAPVETTPTSSAPTTSAPDTNAPAAK